jgi:hypothetical protein
MELHRCAGNSGAPTRRLECGAIFVATIRRRPEAAARLAIVRIRVVALPPGLINVAARMRQAVLLAQLLRWYAAVHPFWATFLAARSHHRL